MARGLNGILAAAFAAVVSGLAVRAFFIYPATISSASMAPALEPGDWVWIDQWTFHWRRPGRGDIVAFRGSPGIPGLDAGRIYLKRLAGLPGERVSIEDDGRLAIRSRSDSPGASSNDFRWGLVSGGYSHAEALRAAGSDPAMARRFPNGQSFVVLGDREVLLLGDNTLSSHDGRAWGPTPLERVEGLVRVWRIR